VDRLRVGLLILPCEPWATARRRWEAAEALGFDHAWTYDHLVWRRAGDRPWFDGFVTLAAAAAVTDRLPFGTLVTSPNLRHPAVLAKTAATLAEVSGGRMQLGIGAGSAGGDAQLLGQEDLSPAGRIERLEEFTEVLVSVLAGGPLDHEGPHYTVRDQGLEPAYPRGDGPPVLVAANGPRGMRLAARSGAGWVTDGAYWQLPDPTPARFRANAARLLADFLEAARASGHPATTHRRVVLVAADADPVLADPEAFLEACHAYAQAGFTDVVFHEPGSMGGDDRAVERLAARALPAAQRLAVASP
jgi:alkanesulfonate monooxygenase SsuD/methylene tetrahydromethanopterin reductase-like flavin-dependent oxidoreductase (luciferase family)